ncbi:hypothetical protein [Streptomyces sp. SAS_270]|uniref:hypothetical protein n=1 Tax=Streptomyces sp. SAS_270 TaxID=3412748 RepID=UPI00403C384F
MLDQALIVLASAAGTAVAQAAGTDAWQGVRERVARIFGRDGTRPSAQTTALERLDRTEAELESAGSDMLEPVRQAAASWQTRFQDLLEDLEGSERAHTADVLRELVAQAQQAGGLSAAGNGIVIGGNADIRAENHSVAAVRMGDVSIANPPVPGSDQS